METLSKNKIKWIKSLRLKKNRDAEKLYIVEGEKMVIELIQFWPEKIVLLCSLVDDLQTDISYYMVDERLMADISSLHTPNKYLAVVQMPTFESTQSNFVLAIDGLQDPGNMGTILRTADWFNVDHIVCSNATVDIFNPKVVQSSMGSIFRVKVSYVNLREYLSSSELPVYGALLEGDNIFNQHLKREGILVIGNEGAGISDEIRPLLQHPLNIPQFGHAESLNVAVAAGILLSEFSANRN